MTVYTIGHSTRALEDLLTLLRSAEVGMVVDVRSYPRSRTNPQFNAERLAEALPAARIAYQHLRALGGRRGSAGDGPSPNGYWRVGAFRNYADYALTPAFAEGLRALLTLTAVRTCAIMCAEAVWWRCHRRIVADYLLAAGREVVHILGPDHHEPARLTEGAVVRGDGTVVYPAAQGDLL